MCHKNKKIWMIVLTAALLLISCRVLSDRQADMSGQEFQSSVDQTVAAMHMDQEEAIIPPEPIEPTDTGDTDAESDHITDTVVVTETHEPIGPMAVTDETCEPTVQVSVSTNCRVGPGQEYARVTALSVGQTARVIGRNAEGTYWIIQPPGGSGHCWLWGRYATVTCATADLAIYEPPPTATPRQATATNTQTPTRTPTVTASPDRTEPDIWCNQQLTLSPISYVSLANCERLSGSGGDLLYTGDAKFRPLSGTRLGIVMVHDVQFDDCHSHSGMGYSEIHRDTIGYNNRVCFQTGDNRFGYFYIVSMDQPLNGWIVIQVRTWMTYR